MAVGTLKAIDVAERNYTRISEEHAKMFKGVFATLAVGVAKVSRDAAQALYDLAARYGQHPTKGGPHKGFYAVPGEGTSVERVGREGLYHFLGGDDSKMNKAERMAVGAACQKALRPLFCALWGADSEEQGKAKYLALWGEERSLAVSTIEEQAKKSTEPVYAPLQRKGTTVGGKKIEASAPVDMAGAYIATLLAFIGAVGNKPSLKVKGIEGLAPFVTLTDLKGIRSALDLAEARLTALSINAITTAASEQQIAEIESNVEPEGAPVGARI